ncbi:hypothetical protein JW826_05165 [Candidatus Woesearchaeota archaeon]|nr:hypothetical protein [Candidatus Woesearchaeota archaeon]
MKEASHHSLLMMLPALIIAVLTILTISIILVMATPQQPSLQVTGCSAEDGESSSPGSWGSTCDNAYPGSALQYDDTAYETHTIRKHGLGYYAGLKINSTNTSVTDCKSIVEVRFCYKWWSQVATTINCDVSVDANKGLSYTTITTSCPGTSEPTNVTCINVTSLENWTCSDFFGSNASGGLAKSEAQHDGTGANGIFNMTWDVFYFNVTYENETAPDTTPPMFTNLANQTLYENQTLSYDIDAYDENNISCFKVNDTARFGISCSGLLVNVTGLGIGTYWIMITVNDTYSNNASGAIYIEVQNSTTAGIQVKDAVPAQDSTLNISSSILIGANVTSGQTISSVQAEVTYPNASKYQLTLAKDLSGGADWYSTGFTIPSKIGRYDVNVTANNTAGNKSSKATYFNAKDPISPSITMTDLSKTILKVGQKTKLSMEATDNYGIGSCWANVTMPNGTKEIVGLDCDGASSETKDTDMAGTYGVVFYANDSSGNTAQATGSFEVYPKIDFNFHLKLVDSGNINITMFKEGNDEVVFSDETIGDNEEELPETTLDFEMISFSKRFQAKLKSVDLASEDDKAFGMDKHFEDLENGSLVIYGIENEYDFSDATVVIYYDDLSYENESDLKLYKCDSYDLYGRECLSGWHDITSTTTKNTTGEYLEFTTTSFSGFSIREYAPDAPPEEPPAEEENPGSRSSTTSAASSITSGGIPYAESWVCEDWSECIDGEQERTCTLVNAEGNKLVRVAKRECEPALPPGEDEKAGVSGKEVEKKLFDITIMADGIPEEGNESQKESYILNIVVLLENFGPEPIEIGLSMMVLDEDGNEIMQDSSTALVEQHLWREYESLEGLKKGRYKVVLEAVFNETTKERIVKEVQIGPEGFFERTRRLLERYNLFNWINLIGLLILIAVTVSYYYFHKRAFKWKGQDEQ